MHNRPIPAFQDFEEAHIEKVWQLLAEKFHFNIPEWKKEFRDFLGKQYRNTEETDAFLIFGTQKINPILNGILKRNSLHPTWQKMVEYVMKKYPSTDQGTVERKNRQRFLKRRG
jgi:hypothetical protein